MKKDRDRKHPQEKCSSHEAPHMAKFYNYILKLH